MAQGYGAYPPGRKQPGGMGRAGANGRHGFGMGPGPAAQPPGGAVPYAQGPALNATGRGTGRGVPGAAMGAGRPAPPASAPKKRGASFWVAIAVVVLCIALAAALAALTLGAPQKSSRMGVPGQLEGKTPEEVQAELNRVVEEGMFNISIASAVLFEDGAAPGELRIENVPGNLYLMRVEIRLDDTGQLVYTTDMIEPNNHIQQDTLDVVLPAGTYNATAVFRAFDPETEAEVGQAAAKITLLVQS